MHLFITTTFPFPIVIRDRFARMVPQQPNRTKRKSDYPISQHTNFNISTDFKCNIYINTTVIIYNPRWARYFAVFCATHTHTTSIPILLSHGCLNVSCSFCVSVFQFLLLLLFLFLFLFNEHFFEERIRWRFQHTTKQSSILWFA